MDKRSIILDRYELMKGGADVTDEELRGQFDGIREQLHAMAGRMERFEARLDGLEKTVTDFRTEVRGHLDAVERRGESLENRVSSQLGGLENRLADKASNMVVSLWGGTLAILIAAATAILKLT